ncbi:MAG TPA: class I SAM-dependent methyltransferase [Candidatus Binatia bacterium]|nr:class I SAM-dependent methyltransferase [Candidatus Binatia bacterium]
MQFPIRQLVRRLFLLRFAGYSGEPFNPRTQAAFEEGTLPPPYLMYLVAGSTDANWFIDSGRFALEAMETSLRRVGADLDQFSTVLDFGCGSGRVIRHLRSRSKLVLHGCDYNRTLVAWCRRHLSFAAFQVNHPNPPLAYIDRQFDLVYAFSVFTHLGVERQVAWLAELRRILRPGGYLIASTSGDGYFEKLDSEQRRRYLAGEIVITLDGRQGKNDCAAYHSEKAFRSLVEDMFTVEDLAPKGALGNPVQDLWLCRRR